RLWSLSEESDVAAVGLVLRAAPADSLAHAQELRDAIRLLRARGKRVLCHLEDGAGAALYVCAAADRVLVSPAGGVRFAGLKTRRIYFASLLEKLGVRAEFVRIGAHKSAPEAFTERAATDVARDDAIDLLQQSERWFVGDLAADRHIEVPEVRRRLAAGPFLAEEARAAGFADALAFDDEVEKALSDLAGRRVELLDEPHSPRTPVRFGRQRSVALVYIDGDIVDGRSRSIPLVGMDLAGSYTLAETLAEIRKDPNVGAVVLRVESPGGSSLASDVIWREVALTARVKPVVASFGQVAASGGYYVAAPATRIFANPLSITGSIGVFYGKADASGLLSKIGVDVETYKTNPRADADSLFRPFSADERTELERKVAQIYGLFVTRVAEGRKLSRDAVDAVAQGRVWTGEQARDRGLVDELGGIRQALAEARSLAGLRADAPIVELPRLRSSLLGKLLGVEGLQAPLAGVALPAGLTPLVRAVLPLAIHAGDVPLARLELEPVEP
ncbi:MAG: signal peptide peptidase SppA, partial [Deltaproteobacteria bacterium]|nr:signal peptide peptidase SppA [Deltaproteobacteria bacterium]